MDSISHLRQSVTVFLSHHPGCLLEREWVRHTLAPDVGLDGFGGSHDSFKLHSIPKKTEIV